MAELWRHGFPTVGATAELARRAEAWGYDGLLLADSQNLVADVYVELAQAAHATTSLRVGTGVTNPLTRHPAVTAAAIATVHAESGGRALLGLARGDSALSQIGLTPVGPSELGDHVRRLRALLRGETTDAGRLTWLDPTLAPVQVDVAATGPKTIAAAAANADRVTLTVGADCDRLRAAIAAARAAGPARVGAYVNVACLPDPHAARTLVRGSTAIFARFNAEHLAGLPERDRPVIAAVGQAYQAARHGRSSAPAAAALTDDFLDRFAVAGTPNDVHERLADLLALGLDHLVLVPGSRDNDPDALAHSDELVADILPGLRDHQPAPRRHP